MKKPIEFDPAKNDKMIVIRKDDDGNYTGWMQKHGKLIETRQIGPETVLQALLTHE